MVNIKSYLTIACTGTWNGSVPSCVPHSTFSGKHFSTHMHSFTTKSSIASPSVTKPTIKSTSTASPSVTKPTIKSTSTAAPSVTKPTIESTSTAPPSVTKPTIKSSSTAPLSVTKPTIKSTSTAPPSVTKVTTKSPSSNTNASPGPVAPVSGTLLLFHY